MDIAFDWDRVKARSNLSKHGVSFEEAMLALSDPLAFTVVDARQIPRSCAFSAWVRRFRAS